MNLLIVGGDGLIGQAVAKKHLLEGDNVYIYDTHVNKFNDYTNLVGTNITDVVESDGLEDVLYNFNFDIISNHAAYVSVGDSQLNVGKYCKNNVGNYGYFLDAIRSSGRKPKKIIHASSMSFYGEGNRFCFTCGRNFFYDNFRTQLEIKCSNCHSDTSALPNDENTPHFPVSIYGVTKQAQENALKVFSFIHDIQCTALRYFSVYSTDQTPLNPFTGVLSVIANKIINEKEISLMEDGFQSRDLIHVDDVARAHFLASRNISNTNFEIFNVGTGNLTSINKIASHMRDVLCPNKPIVYNYKMRPGDIKDSYACLEKSFSKLNFRYQNQLFDQIDIYCQYIKDNWNKFVVSDLNTLDVTKDEFRLGIDSTILKEGM